MEPSLRLLLHVWPQGVARSPFFLSTPRSVFSSLLNHKQTLPFPGIQMSGTEAFLLTVSPDQGFDALAPPLAEPVHHKEQQREDEEGRDAADDESHPAGHGVKKTVSIWRTKQEIKKPICLIQQCSSPSFSSLPGSRQVNLQHSFGSLRKC